MTTAKYERRGPSLFLPLKGAQGAWREDEQHMAPVSGIIAQAISEHQPRAGVRLARISYDILGVMPAAPTRVEVRTIRPGRSIELLEAIAVAGDREIVRARAWRLATSDTSAVEGTALESLPPPEDFPVAPLWNDWPGGFIASVELRRDPQWHPGRARCWVRTAEPLVQGPVDASAAYLSLVDTANGIAVRQDPYAWTFPNLDLTVHLFREPDPTWVGLDTRVTFADCGIGLTSTVLHDIHGPVGTAAQILTIRPL